MKKEAFFEVLGELDDNIVKEAEKPMKKKKYLKIYGTIAACFALLLIAFPLYQIFQPDDREKAPDTTDTEIGEQNTLYPSSCDIAPMVYVNDTLYDILRENPLL